MKGKELNYKSFECRKPPCSDKVFLAYLRKFKR